ncbi:hypothetical protein [Achromobacter sp. 2789STDY5608628]|uniref:hypothetical protein n=1 Tax=Achromobacter sp. 2789STDY5608628 TaxID=1806493 RepID=UPI0006BFD705|nr:hypothetical protein [Achromobacter sp. 2789STDY5608628]CUJ67706.1 Uncharacterised protein [Achromobacter sp. 2789STDY5608628]
MNTAVSILILVAAFTWLLMLIAGCCAGLWLLWRRRGLRKWIADFDRGLEREERARAVFQRRHRFRP